MATQQRLHALCKERSEETKNTRLDGRIIVDETKGQGLSSSSLKATFILFSQKQNLQLS